MNSQIGSLVSIDGKDHISVARSQIGFALFGPYVELEPGNYEVDFEFRVGSSVSPASDEFVCKLDVACGFGTDILTRVDVSADQLESGETRKIALPFSISERTAQLEFRVWSLGKLDFAIAVQRPVRLVSAPPSLQGASGFCDQHAVTLRNLSSQGATISRRSDSAYISLGGVNVVARHREDFQIISEVLVFNTYNILPLRDSVVIDVGMNIGLASVFFAKQRWAKKVYGFEPFRDPFTRSKETFDSNKTLKEKLFARNAGLSDKNERPIVHYSTEGTIAAGINGAASGPVQPRGRCSNWKYWTPPRCSAPSAPKRARAAWVWWSSWIARDRTFQS